MSAPPVSAMEDSKTTKPPQRHPEPWAPETPSFIRQIGVLIMIFTTLCFYAADAPYPTRPVAIQSKPLHPVSAIPSPPTLAPPIPTKEFSKPQVQDHVVISNIGDLTEFIKELQVLTETNINLIKELDSKILNLTSTCNTKTTPKAVPCIPNVRNQHQNVDVIGLVYSFSTIAWIAGFFMLTMNMESGLWLTRTLTYGLIGASVGVARSIWWTGTGHLISGFVTMEVGVLLAVLFMKPKEEVKKLTGSGT